MEVGDLYDLMNVIVRLHHNGELVETHTLSREGMPVLADFIANCSEINLAKLAVLKKVNPHLVNVISAATLGRKAQNLNKLIGDDLSKVLPYADDYHVTIEEEERVIGRHRSRPGRQTIRPCTFYMQPRGCKRGEECEYMHLSRDK